MKILKKNNVSIVLSLILIFLISAVGLAEELTLKEAVKIGLRNNKDMRDIRENIEELTGQLALNEARQDWQVELEADYNQKLTGDNKISVNSQGEQKNLSLNINKTFSSGLSINPVLTMSDSNSDSKFTVTLNKHIYPSISVELDKQYYKTKKQLLKARQNYMQQKANKILSWLESYLSLKRMYEKRNIYRESLKQAEANMKEVQEAEKIKEAGKQEILTARLSVKEAEYSLKDIKYKIEKANMDFERIIGLKENQTLIIDNNYQFIDEWRKKARRLTDKYIDKSELMAAVADNNYNLYANRIDRKILQKELEWLKKEGKTDVNLTGSYNTETEELVAGFNVSCKLYDGGQQEIEYETKESEIAANLENYSDLYTELENQLENYKNTLKLSKLQLEKQEINLARSQHELKTARQQYEIGLIDYLEYQEQWIESKEAKINLKSLADQVFIDRLELLKFIDIEEVTGGLVND